MRRPLQGLRRDNVVRESLAGATLLAIAVPLNIGYAQIAGLPVTAGLYALVVPTLVYVALTSSRQVVASPDAAAAALVFSSLVGLGVGDGDFAGMAAAQAILCGAFLVVAAVLRWGFLANFLSRPILMGFIAGLSLEVLLSQVRKMVGLGRGEAEGFFAEVVDLLSRIGSSSWVSVLLSIGALVVLVAGRRFAPRVPWALLVLVAATALTAWLHLEDRGVAVLGVIDAGPPAFGFPALSFAQWASLIPSALALALVTMAEGVLLSRSYGEQRGYRTDPDQDLLAFGAANIAAGVSMSFSVGSSTSRTAAMDQLGSRTQLPSVVLAGGALLLLLFGTDVLAQIPAPVIGAVVAVAVVKLLGITEFAELARYSRYELVVALVCVLGVLILGPLQGLAVAFVLSLVNLARRASRVQVDLLGRRAAPAAAAAGDAFTTVIERPDDSGVLVLRVVGPVFFANAATIAERVLRLVEAQGDRVRAVVLDAEAIGDVDVTGAENLRRLRDTLRARGVVLAVARIRAALRTRLVRLEVLDGLAEFPTNRDAVDALTAPAPRSGG